MANDPALAFNVFVSWSLDRSRAVATALHRWLPLIIQRCRPWMSDRDIYTGQRWRSEVAHHLATIKVGIICVTPENLGRPYLNFEAGALSRTVSDDSRVCCYGLKMKPTDLEGPLADFQAVEATFEGTWRLVQSINATLEGSLVAETALRELFEAMWPKLEAELKAVPNGTLKAGPKRSADDMIEEILARVRRIERDSTDSFAFETKLAKTFENVAMREGLLEPVRTTGRDITRLRAPRTEDSALGVFKETAPEPREPDNS